MTVPFESAQLKKKKRRRRKKRTVKKKKNNAHEARELRSAK